jgi:hypothetical protein
MFWLDQFQPMTGGRRLDKFRMPLLFLLELFIIILLCIAAAKPMIQKNKTIERVMVILDDSVSMRAGGENDSPRSKAIRELKVAFPEGGKNILRFLAAGSSVRSIYVSQNKFEQWKCDSPESKIDEAIALANEMDPEAKILVVSDHLPKDFEENGRLQWWAFGRPMKNVGIVNAARSSADKKERFLIEIERSDFTIESTSVEISSGDQIIKAMKVDFNKDAGENHNKRQKNTRRLIFELPKTSADIRLSLPTDSLEADNEIVLLAGNRHVVRVENRLSESPLRKAVEKVVASDSACKVVKDHADVIFTEKTITGEPPSTWITQFLTGGEPKAYVGPFVVSRNHSLLDGMEFSGLIWAAGESLKPLGTPIVSAGNIPLITDRELRTGGHILSIVLQPEKSNLLTSPNWPIMIWNLLNWRAENLPGVGEANYRLGSRATITSSSDTINLEIMKPDGTKKILPMQNASYEIDADEPGIYRVKDSDREYRFAVNLLNRDETDLADANSGKVGHWTETMSLYENYQSLAGLFLLIAILALAGHHVLIASRHEGGPIR